MPVLAYHITWTTYGTWLPGDGRGWVRWGESGVKPPDPERERDAGKRMVESAVMLTEDQWRMVEQTVRDHCLIRGWRLHAVNARTNHIHVVVTADRDPQEVMNQFKAWCSRRLNEQAGTFRKRWWTKHGSTKWINDEIYLGNAVRYVEEGQD